MKVKGQEQVAAMFGVAPKTITEWQVLGFPVALQGGPGMASEYDAPACIKWLVDREVGKVQSETPKDRLNRLQGDKIEFDMAKDRRLYVPASEIEPLWNSAVLTAREFLIGETSRWATLAVGRDENGIKDLLDEGVETFLTKLSQWQVDDSADGEDAVPDGEDQAGELDE
jgi:hypothetical protein